MKAAWALLNVVQLLSMAAWTVAWISLALVLMVLALDRELPLVLARRAWAPGMLWLAGARLQVEPLPVLAMPCIFVMNHQSSLDICCAFAALPSNLRFVAKHTLARVPFLGWYMWATGMVFINREDRRQAVQSLRRAGEAIRSGRSILVYPEGTRSRGTFALQPFKRGPFALAVEARVPLVPVAVEGAGRVMPAGGIRIRPGAVRLKVGAPIPVREGVDRDTLMREAHAAVAALHQDIGGAGSQGAR